MKDIKELRDFGIQMLTVGCLTEPQVKRMCELIGDVCERAEELEQKNRLLRIDLAEALEYCIGDDIESATKSLETALKPK